MTHPGLEELVAKFREARREAEADTGNPEQLKVHRQLAEDCPAFTQNLLFLAWRLSRSEQPERTLEDRLAEIQRLLELAVLGSYRSAPAVVELGYFLDTYRNAPHEAARLYEEAGAKALETQGLLAGIDSLLERRAHAGDPGKSAEARRAGRAAVPGLHPPHAGGAHDAGVREARRPARDRGARAVTPSRQS